MAVINKIFCATDRDGGADGNMDTIAYLFLNDNDMCMVVESSSNTVYFYRYESSNNNTSNPDDGQSVIVPDDNTTGTGAWLLQSGVFTDLTIIDDIIDVADDMIISDSLEIKGSLQVGDADGTGANATFYSDSVGDHMVFDKTGKTFTLTDIALIASTIDAGTDFTIGDLVITDGVITDATGLSLAGDVDCTGAHSATTYDADTNFTVDGLVLTADTITNDAALAIVASSVNIETGIFSVGVTGSAEGDLKLWGDATANGGVARFYTADDSDDNIQRYDISVINEDFRIGPDTDADSFKYTRATDIWSFTGTGIDVVGACTANTFDADTDFTVGGTVITDGFITDSGTLAIDTPGGVQIRDTVGADDAQVFIGTEDTQRGQLYIYGDATGDTSGGGVSLYTAADHDTDIAAYVVSVIEDDLHIGPNTNTSALKFTGSGAAVTAAFNVALDVDAACTATTFDADTDFTIGGTVITNATITDDGVFYIKTADGTYLTDSGAAGSNANVYIGTGDSICGLLNLMADNDTSGPKINFQVCPDQDHNGTTEWTITNQDNTDDLIIGDNNDPNMLKFLGGTRTIKSTVAFDVDAACTATTFDADTDFTVGGTTITDGTITDDGNLYINAATRVYMQNASSLEIGDDDTTRGILRLRGDNASAGGAAHLYTGADGDAGGLQNYSIQVTADDLIIGTGGNTDALMFVGTGGNDCTLKATVAFDVDAALTATTVDADTDFTVGDTIITNGVITDATGLDLAAAVTANTLTLDSCGILQTGSTPAGVSPMEYNGYFYATRVYNPVYADIAEMWRIDMRSPLQKFIPGSVLAMSDSGTLRPVKQTGEEPTMGIVTDTYGICLGNNYDHEQRPIAIAGKVLAFVDRIYTPGTPLWASGQKQGMLTSMSNRDRKSFPERVIAKYLYKEPRKNWGPVDNKCKVNDRHWVKVV